MSRGCLRGCSTLVVSCLLITGVAYAGFRWGDGVFPAMERWLSTDSTGLDEPVPSPALAEETLDRLESLQEGRLAGGRLVWRVRDITASHAYQRSTRANESNKADNTNFSRALPRCLNSCSISRCIRKSCSAVSGSWSRRRPSPR